MLSASILLSLLLLLSTPLDSRLPFNKLASDDWDSKVRGGLGGPGLFEPEPDLESV